MDTLRFTFLSGASRLRSFVFFPENDFVKLLSWPGLGILVRISQKKEIMDKQILGQVHDLVSILG